MAHGYKNSKYRGGTTSRATSGGDPEKTPEGPLYVEDTPEDYKAVPTVEGMRYYKIVS